MSEAIRRRVLDVLSWIAWKLGQRGRRVLSNIAGVLISIAMVKRRRIAIRNIRLAMPALEQSAIRRLARRSFVNLALVLAEILATPYMARTELRRYFRFTNPTIVRRALAERRGVILLSAHLANWEWSALVAALEFNMPLLVVVKEQRDRIVNDWLWGMRRMTGNELVPMSRAAKAMLRWLTDGGIVALLGDQAAEPSSDVFVPLFGRPAATYKAPVNLARRTGALLVFAYCLRNRGGGYDVVFDPLPEANDPNVPVEDVVAAYNRKLESAILRAPEQWVWQHDRWKYNPPSKTP
ncbi:MAG: lysophospholipid acyltransferase family protein [Chlorobi bacterium]|nr:lysophospholipid acyltransferase family protein [Chlorobiota bacterium]